MRVRAVPHGRLADVRGAWSTLLVAAACAPNARAGSLVATTYYQSDRYAWLVATSTGAINTNSQGGASPRDGLHTQSIPGEQMFQGSGRAYSPGVPVLALQIADVRSTRPLTRKLRRNRTVSCNGSPFLPNGNLQYSGASIPPLFGACKWYSKAS